MKPVFSRSLSIALLGMFCTTATFAAMPLNTDDTGTQGQGKFQVELGGAYSRNTENEGGLTVKETGWELSSALSYGLSDNIDLVAGVPWGWAKVKVDDVTDFDDNGIGDMSLQLKWRFFETGDKRTSLALKPGLSIPTGDDEKGFGTGRVCEEVTLIATHATESGALHFNLGYRHHDYSIEEVRELSRKDIWRASMAGELNIADKLRAVADLGIETNEERDADANPVYLLGGLIYGVSDKMDLDIGIRGGLNDAESDTAVLAGMTKRF